MQLPPFEEAEQPSSVANTIYIVATGGTISGVAASATSPRYETGKLSIRQLLATIPELTQFSEEIEEVDLFQLDSSDISIQHWLQLAKYINQLLQRAQVKGVVITHGTDTLEETAYFLNLVVKSDKPVVLVGSMRAATSLSPDGPLSLFNAIAVVHSPESIGRGVMVVMNDTIFDGRDVTKSNTTQVNTFTAPNSGPLGHVNFGKVEFDRRVTRKNTMDTPFDVEQLDVLPTVEIIYDYAGATGSVLKAVIAQQPAGIVIAGAGDGNVTTANRGLLTHARERDIQVVRSSRTGSGRVTQDNIEPVDSQAGIIAGDNLNPQKARILLMLALTQTQDADEIRSYFSIY